jgi:tetratricopeptide (TPR) repeat protein
VRHLDAFKAAADFDPLQEVTSAGNHVLDVAVESLSNEAKQVLAVLAAFHDGVPLMVLDSLCGRLSEGLESLVQGLIVRGLVDFSSAKRTCSLHAIVRAYAYRTVEDKSALHERIRQRLAVLVPEKVDWDDRNQCSLLLELFRQTALSGRVDEAATMFFSRIERPLWRRADFLLARTLGGALMTREIDAQLPISVESGLVNSLSAYSAFLGEPADAVALIDGVLGRFEDEARSAGQYFAMLSNRAYYQIRLGELVSAERDLQDCMTESRRSNRHDGYGPLRLALLESYRGHYQESRSLLRLAMFTFGRWMDGRCHVWAYRVWRALHMDRPQLACRCAGKALQIARQVGDERLLARGQFHMGAALACLAVGVRSSTSFRKAESFLSDALSRLRSLRLVEFEPSCLRVLGEVAIHAGRTGEAADYLNEALSLAQRCSYRFDEAEIQHSRAMLYAVSGDFSQEGACLSSALERAVGRGQEGNTYAALARRVRATFESRRGYV